VHSPLFCPLLFFCFFFLKMRFLLSLMLIPAEALTFGSLSRPALPPPSSTYKIRSFVDPSHYIHVAPTYKHMSTLVCCEDCSNVTHYFLYSKHTIHKCIWRAPTTSERKAEILRRLRKWYHATSNRTLGANFGEDDDMYAWVSSHMEDMDKDE
jgi:hypothetical protein